MLVPAELLSQLERLFVDTMNKRFRKSVHLTSLTSFSCWFLETIAVFLVFVFEEQVLMLRSLRFLLSTVNFL